MEKQKIAIFDLDGTCFNGNTGIELMKRFYDLGEVSSYKAIAAFALYLTKKAGFINDNYLTNNLYSMYANSMKGKDSKQIELLAEDTWENIKDKTFEYPVPLLKSLGRLGYKSVLISGSPIEIVVPASRYLGFDERDVIAGELETDKDGIYTGGIKTIVEGPQKKYDVLIDYASKYDLGIDWNSSIAFGNDSRDETIFNYVGHSFLISPNSRLKSKASNSKNWHIITPTPNSQEEILRTILDKASPQYTH